MFSLNAYRQLTVVRRLLWLSLLATLLLATLLPALSQAQTTVQLPDLGDAPDSTNHTGGGNMPAYPWVAVASYPTVFDPATGAPPGPLHREPRKDAWLGGYVTGEKDADLLPDDDGITNIDPPSLSPNRDKADDGVFTAAQPTIKLPHCNQTRFQYDMRVVGPVRPRYTNVWFDYNRDGDWADSFYCSTSSAVIVVHEWAVQNQATNLGPGGYTLVTPAFLSFNTSPTRELWMRISLTEIPVPNTSTTPADGRGTPNGYRYGETEDYLLKPGSGYVYAGT